MRVMVLVKATPDSERGGLPPAELVAAMGRYNEELVEAGVFVDAGGLLPSAAGRRVRFGGAAPEVTEGPFAATGELVSGWWLWQVDDVEEAVRWLQRAPFGPGAEVEVRPVAEMGEVVDALDDAAVREQHDRLRARLDAP